MVSFVYVFCILFSILTCLIFFDKINISKVFEFQFTYVNVDNYTGVRFKIYACLVLYYRCLNTCWYQCVVCTLATVDFPSSSWIKNGKNSSKFTTKSTQSKRKTGGGMNHLNIHKHFRFLRLKSIFFQRNEAQKLFIFLNSNSSGSETGKTSQKRRYLYLQLRK